MDTITLNSRRFVAHACGFEDARFLVYLKETIGMSITESAIWCAKNRLRISWADIAYELRLLGKKESSILAEIEEAKSAMLFVNERTR